MNERFAEKQKAKGKSKEAKPDGGDNPSPKKRSSVYVDGSHIRLVGNQGISFSFAVPTSLCE